MLEGDSVPGTGGDVTSIRLVRQMDQRISELERQLGRKTMEVEVLKGVLDKVRLNASPAPPARVFLCLATDRSASTYTA
ncbi:hypothetical protein NOVOSPHI9U_260251 [Novosphingobium sp. 9U]|nr:hypothetical protein NOVOSPHI9U_260251 [Novosphingobium sp. 9U]